MVRGTWDESIRPMLSFGAIIGVTELYDALPFTEQVWADPCAEGPICFLLRNSRLFRTPIPHKGRVNLCELSVDVSKRVEDCKSHCIDVGASELRRRFNRAMPPGRVPRRFLRQEHAGGR